MVNIAHWLPATMQAAHVDVFFFNVEYNYYYFFITNRTFMWRWAAKQKITISISGTADIVLLCNPNRWLAFSLSKTHRINKHTMDLPFRKQIRDLLGGFFFLQEKTRV